MKKCLYEYKDRPPCLILKTKKYKNIFGFIDDAIEGTIIDNTIIHELKCINLKDTVIEVNDSKCINCMFCITLCPDHLMKIDKDYFLASKCSNFNIEKDKSIDKSLSENFFKNELVCFPKKINISAEKHYESFEAFTQVKEVQNISVWGANLLKFLSKDVKAEVTIELPLSIKNRSRDGRIDIVLNSKDLIIFCEAKVSFKKMREEGRYVSQIISYEEQYKNLLLENKIKKKYHQFLLIGGNETDLLPEDHSKCTSIIGNQSKEFYKNLIDHKIQFISANALLCLSILRLKSKNNYNIDYVINKFLDKDIVGLLSCGFIKRDNNRFKIIPFV